MVSLFRKVSPLTKVSLLVLLAAVAAQAISDDDIDKLLSTKFEKSVKDETVRKKMIHFLKNYPFAGYTILRDKVDDVLEKVAKEHQEKGASRADVPKPPKDTQQIVNNNYNNSQNARCDCSCKISASNGGCKAPICPPVPKDESKCAGAPLCDPLCAPDVVDAGDGKKRIKARPRINNGTVIFASLMANLTSSKSLKGEIMALFGTDLDAFDDLDSSVQDSLMGDVKDIMHYYTLQLPSEVEKLLGGEKKRNRRDNKSVVARKGGSSGHKTFGNWAKSIKSGADAVTAIAGCIQSILGLCGLTSGQSEPPNINQTIIMNMKNIVDVNFNADCNCNNKCSQWKPMKRCETTCPNNPGCDKWRCVCN